MATIADIECVANGLRRVTVDNTRSRATRTLWVRARVRKATNCVRCSGRIYVGNYAYRTTLDTDYRSARMCEACADTAPGA